MGDKQGLKDETKSNVENDKIDKIRKRGKPKGLPKTGGRTKGTPNKASTKWSEVLDAESFCIPEQAIKMFMDKTTPPNIKFSILQFLATYTTASIKPKESEQEDETQSENKEPADILSIVNGK